MTDKKPSPAKPVVAPAPAPTPTPEETKPVEPSALAEETKPDAPAPAYVRADLDDVRVQHGLRKEGRLWRVRHPEIGMDLIVAGSSEEAIGLFAEEYGVGATDCKAYKLPA